MSEKLAHITTRWQDYVLEQGVGLEQFWKSHLAERERHVLFVLAKGFDPRMCAGLKMLLGAGGAGKRDVVAIEFSEGPNSASKAYADRVQANVSELQNLVSGHTLRSLPVKIWSSDGRRIGSRSAGALFKNLSDFAGYTDVVADISAMPRNIGFPLIAKILHLIDSAAASNSGIAPINLHLLICEDPELDRLIREEGIEDTADYVHPFSGKMDRESTAGEPKVWIPLLGEGQHAQLKSIYDKVKPDEICPVVPSPSRNPRRGDDLILEYRELLFDQLRVEPRNFIYAAERNPFEVYRQIRRAIVQYRETLAPLGGSKFVLSALSSKLLSVGALLVAYELRSATIDIGIAHVECHGYIIDDAVGSRSPAAGELYGLWLAGEFDGT